ncbi:MAG: undecaprenyl-diphosphate phosphatase [bacterium]|nr:undecaprenyl-diphosphate phosphatase [bacterium]MDZ4231553.1 undecaprenyl-diphosphate phosphatase [Patescibacteria group bacterium]
MSFIEAIVLGIAQGITEWVPVSSEGVTVLLGVNFFDGITATELIRLSLYLHLGTFLAALFYFRKDVGALLKQLFGYRKADEKVKATLNFYVLATLVSGGLGYILIRSIEGLEGFLGSTSKAIVIGLGVLLLVTGFFQLGKRRAGQRLAGDANLTDSLLTGVAQGLAVLPGLSRSGMTVATLLLRDFDDAQSLKMSFILSLPIVLVGNILLNTTRFVFTGELFMALLLAFLIGLATIHALLKFAKKIRFGYFVIFFGVLVLASVFI